MRPFFNVFGFTVPAFGIMTVAAGAAAFLFLFFMTRKTPLRQDASNLFFFALAGAMGGAYILYFMLNLPAALSRWDIWIQKYPFTEAFTLLARSVSGFVFYGGLIGGGAMMVVYSRMFKVPLLPYLDVFAMVIPVAHAVGRVGCFLSGCCYGMEVSHTHPLGVVYPIQSISAPPGVLLLAVPLIEAGLNILLAGFLFTFKNRRALKDGTLAAVYLICYSVIRFTLEFFRGDLERGLWMGVSLSQYISAGLFLCGVLMLTRAVKGVAVSR